MATQLVF